MASSPIPAFKVLEQSSVSPPNSSVQETSIPLSFCDLMWLNLNDMERIIFYSIPAISTSHFVKNLLPSLKTSLSLTLQHFFPLAGHVIFSPDSDGNKFHYHYNDGDSISFTVAESDRDFTHLAGDDARSVMELEFLVPALTAVSADATPLMAVQVTVFPSQGVCLGLTINHGACDGSSAANFLKSWAATCKSGAASAVLSTTPLFDRSLFVYPKELHAASLEFAMKSRELRSVTPSSRTTDHDAAKADMVIASFWLTRDQIEKLKRWISEEKVAVHCSTFVVACAYVWTCQVRARGSPRNQVAWFGFPVNARGRLRPPVPEGYFGNCLGICLSNAKVSELVKEDGVRAAAEVLGRAIDGLGDGVLGDVDAWVEMGKIFKDKRPLSVSGSPGFRFYDCDFGWGRPLKVEVLSLRNTGAMSISEGKEGGGIGIGLAAPKKEMDRFSYEFADGLRFLHSF